MPVKPKAEETKEQFVSRCIGEEVTAGYEQSQAAAICYSKWDRRELSKQKFSDPQKRVQSKLNFERKYAGINLAPLEKGPNDPCYEDYVQIGTKMLDGREVPNCIPLEKVVMEMEGDCMCKLAEYPWEKCLEDQMKRYESKAIAEAVCGMIKEKYGS
jgi:hypothetical protein